MTTQDIIQYCFFYKGEELIPSKFDQKNEGKLWVAEKFICEEIPHLIDKKNPRNSIKQYIESYVSKWSPYKYDDIMNTYQSYAEAHHN